MGDIVLLDDLTINKIAWLVSFLWAHAPKV